MQIHYKILIVLAGMGFFYLFPEADVFLAFTLILVFGIPHGATDHILHNINQEQELDKKPKAKFLIYYLSIILLYALLWHVLPALSLVLFIIISAFHFGETQLLNAEKWGKAFKNKWIKNLSYFFWGLTVLLLIFQAHIEEVSAIISPYLISEEMMLWIDSNFTLILTISLIATFSGLILIGIKAMVIQLIEMAVLFLLANFTSLLFSFAIFFAFWHSRDAVREQILKIRGYKNDFSLKDWGKLALPYTLISLIGIVLIISFSSFQKVDIPLLTLFFILVALITLPHVFVMNTFYRN